MPPSRLEHPEYGRHTMFGSNVQPRKRVLRDKPAAWVCACNHGSKIQAGYLTKCSDCGEKRP